jgi:hypothetical protein
MSHKLGPDDPATLASASSLPRSGGPGDSRAGTGSSRPAR